MPLALAMALAVILADLRRASNSANCSLKGFMWRTLSPAQSRGKPWDIRKLIVYTPSPSAIVRSRNWRDDVSGQRNHFGYNDTADCYRTINGVRYIGWLVSPSSDRIAAYRAAGVRCRKVRADELFIAEADTDIAQNIDRNAP